MVQNILRPTKNNNHCRLYFMGLETDTMPSTNASKLDGIIQQSPKFRHVFLGKTLYIGYFYALSS